MSDERLPAKVVVLTDVRLERERRERDRKREELIRQLLLTHGVQT